MYFQRPLKSQRQGVGKCTFEPKKARVADSHPAFELSRMLSFVNNIKIKGPQDVELRPLSQEEFEKAKPMFFRKSKPQFDFEDIAKAIAGKGKYQHIKDDGDKPYKFNYRMSQSVMGCPTIASLISVFGDDYENAIATSFASFILTTIGVSLSSRKRKGGMGLYLGIGLALSFGYILLQTVSATFAINAGTPAILAAWIPNIVFAVIAYFCYRQAPN